MFGTRYYDSAYGRWEQQDPIAGTIANPNTTNRYIYAGDNPVNFVDPTGRHFLHDLDDVIDAGTAFLEGFASGVAIGGGVALCSTLAGCATGGPAILAGLAGANDAFERVNDVSKRRQRRGSRH